MVTEATIQSDLIEIESLFKKYEMYTNDFNNNRIWEGASRDNAVSKANEFISTFKGPITQQMNNLSNAVNLFKRYKLTKEYLKTLESNYNRATANENEELANSYKNEISYTSSQIESLKKQIEAKLTAICGLKISSSSKTSNTLSKTRITETTTNNKNEANKNNTETTSKPLTGTSSEKIIAKAEEIHQYMENNNYTYCVYGGNSYEECGSFGKSHGLNNTFEESKTGYHNTCCATYVSWVLQETGHLSKSEHSNGADTLANTLKNKGWTKVPANKLQPGDVMVFSGHVQIYGDNAEIYNAGSGRSIRGDVTQNSGRKNCNYGLRAPE